MTTAPEVIEEFPRPAGASEGEWATARELAALAQEVCEGNADALRFCLSLSAVALTYDHAVDGDPMDRGTTERAFLAMMLDWPVNRFVREASVPLTCAMAAAIGAWKSSDLPGARLKAYDCLSEVWSVVAFLLGGWERVDRVMPRVRETLSRQMTLNDQRGDK